MTDQRLELEIGAPVEASDGRVGRVDLLLHDDDGQMSGFVVRKGGLLSKDVIVPVDWIRSIDGQVVCLVVERADLDRLPTYRSDSAIAADIDQALWADELIRKLDF